MSTDPLPPEPRETAVTGRAPDSPADGEAQSEPLLAELADDDNDILDADPIEPGRGDRPPRRRRTGHASPPPPPHPGFWWAKLWCVGMLIVCQVIPAIGIVVVAIVISLVRNGQNPEQDPQGAQQQLQQQVLLPAVATSQVMLIVFSLAVLRLVVGRDWRREVAWRLPSVAHVVLALLLWPALAISASGVYLVAKKLPPLNDFLSYFVAVYGTLGVVAASWGVVRLTTGRDWTKVLARQRPVAQLLPAAVGCLAVLTVGASIFRLVNPHLPSFNLFGAGMMEQVVKEFRTWPPGVAILVVGLGPGLGEELWCRAFLGRGLVGRHGVVMGVILTSFFFGAIHGDPHQGTMAAVMGLALHFSYLMTRSLWVPMLLHFLNNSLSVIADKLPDLPRERLQNIDTDPGAIPWPLFAASVCLLATVGWALFSSRGRLVRIDGSPEPPWQPPFAGVAHPPAGSGTAVVYPWPGVLPTLAVIAGVVGLGSALYWF